MDKNHSIYCIIELVIFDNMIFQIVPIIYWLWYLSHAICNLRAKKPINAKRAIERWYLFFVSFNILPLLIELRRLEAAFIQMGGIVKRLITALLNRNNIFRSYVCLLLCCTSWVVTQIVHKSIFMYLSVK